MRYLTQRSTRQKIMLYLSDMARKKGKSTFVLPFNRQQMADFLSVDRSALSAELSKMKKEGLIDYQKDKFTLLQRVCCMKVSAIMLGSFYFIVCSTEFVEIPEASHL